MDAHWREKRKGDIKDKTKKEINAYDPLNKKSFNYQQMKDFVDNALNTYNNRPHGSLGKMSPFHMEKALYQHYNERNEDLKDIPPLAKNDQNENALQISDVKEQAIIHFTAKAKVLPVNELDYRFYQYLEEGFERVIDTVKEQQDFIIESIMKQLKDATKQREDMYELNLQLQQQIHSIQVESEKQRIAREEIEQKREKKKNAIKAPIRETLEEEEFFFILELVKHNNFVGARKKSAIILMYLTGLRVSNLLVFTVRHAMQLLEQGETTLPLIKRGPQRFSIKLSDQGRMLLKKYHTLLITLMVNKEQSMPLFTTQVCFQKPIDRTSLDKEINTVLTKASDKLGKHIRTHSFRATIITNYLHETPVDVVQHVVGHKDIKTTALYKKNQVNKEEMRGVLKKLDKVMFKKKQKL
jgi:site-specific recombinase XerD